MNRIAIFCALACAACSHQPTTPFPADRMDLAAKQFNEGDFNAQKQKT